MHHCHCSRCRKHSGAAFVTDGFVAAGRFRWLSGEDALRSYRELGWTSTRVFCGTCCSSLGGRDDRWPDVLVVNAGTLDDDPGSRPLYHIYVGSKAPWFTITDSLTQCTSSRCHRRMGERMAETVKGACLCGAVQFEVTLPTFGCNHCHCSICRRFCGAAYGTFFQVPRERFRLLSGERDVKRFRTSQAVQRAFCGVCGSSLFGEMEAHQIVSVALAAMREPIDREPERHVFWDDRAPWVRIGDDLPRLGRVEGVHRLGDRRR